MPDPPSDQRDRPNTKPVVLIDGKTAASIFISVPTEKCDVPIYHAEAEERLAHGVDFRRKGGTAKMRCSLFLGLAVIALGLVPAPHQSKLERTDRPVFRSAREVAGACRTFLKVFPDGKALAENSQLYLTKEQISQAVTCKAYIEGVLDEGLENTFGERYYPVSSSVPSLGKLVSTFVKYTEDHPEQRDFAACTLIDKSARLIAIAEARPR
jgi:hypothetical protein